MRMSDWSSDVCSSDLPPPILDPTPPPGSSLTRTPTRPDSAEDALRRELYLFALYRTLEAALLALMVFSPFGGLIGEPRDPFLAMAVAIAYLPMSLALLLATRREPPPPPWQAPTGRRSWWEKVCRAWE